MITNPFPTLSKYVVSEYNLMESQANALFAFKSNMSKEINGAVRYNNITPELTDLISNLEIALEKIPSYDNKIVFRNLNFLDFQIDSVKDFFKENLGQVIRFEEFQSCTKREIFTGNKNSHNFIIEITTSNKSLGKDIHKIYQECKLDDKEQEVLFQQNACFKVNEINPDKYIKVKLTEVESEKSILFPIF